MLEDLILYKKYVDFIYYTNMIMIKYPKVERNGLVNDIKKSLYDGLYDIIKYNQTKDTNYLEKLDIEFKFFLTLIRVSYKSKYISSNNYKAFSRKVLMLLKIEKGLINAKPNE